jgi:hypothetical protein
MNARFTTPLKALTLAVALLAGLAPAIADAHPRARVGVWIGGPFWWPGYWGPPLVVERPVIVHQQPVEPLVVQPSAAQQNHLWYYCRDAQMYYPYVTSCASPWQEVPATSSPTAAPAAAATPEAPAPAPAPAATPAPAASRTAPAPVPPAPTR